MRQIKSQRVETSHGLYDIFAVSPEEFADEFGCENSCHRCKKICEHGIAMRELFEQ